MAIDFELTDEQRLLKDTVRQVFKQFEPRRAEFREKMEKRIFIDEVWHAFADAGFLGALVPEQYGGTNMGLLSLVLVMEEMSSMGYGNAIMMLTAMDALCVLNAGSEAMKRKWLPRMTDGSTKFCFAITEPDAGTNTFRISTLARSDGDHFVVNGSKTFITGVEAADYMLLVTRTTSYQECVDRGLPKAHGFTLMLVDTKTPGLEKQLLPTRGIEGMNQWTLFFNDMRVPKENVIGEVDNGALALFYALNPERIIAGSLAVGMTELVMRKAVDYAKERKLFGGKPFGAYQAIAHPLAEIKIQQELVRMMVYRSAWAYDKGLNPVEVGMYANMAKYSGAELAIKAVDRAIQTHGGNGFSTEYGLIDLWQDARLMRTAPISAEMILNYVGEHVLGLPRSY